MLVKDHTKDIEHEQGMPVDFDERGTKEEAELHNTDKTAPAIEFTGRLFRVDPDAVALFVGSSQIGPERVFAFRFWMCGVLVAHVGCFQYFPKYLLMLPVSGSCQCSDSGAGGGADSGADSGADAGAVSGSGS